MVAVSADIGKTAESRGVRMPGCRLLLFVRINFEPMSFADIGPTVSDDSMVSMDVLSVIFQYSAEALSGKEYAAFDCPHRHTELF